MNVTIITIVHKCCRNNRPTVAIGGHSKRGHGIKEAGSQPAQTTVTQAGIFLQLLQLLNVQPKLVHGFIAGRLNAKIYHGVLQ